MDQETVREIRIDPIVTNPSEYLKICIHSCSDLEKLKNHLTCYASLSR